MLDIRQYGITPFGAVPNERQLAHFKMKKAFFHFGVNTFTDMEWGNGEEMEKTFAPTEMDVEQWIQTIKKAGFDLAILTAKHHDGFCLWPSAHTEHSVKNSPYKNGKGDVVREFTDACRQYDIKVGIYLSPWDRNAPFWGTDEYSNYYALQLDELLTNYGRIDEIWWDGAGSAETKYDWRLWAELIRKKQPHACIFGSMGATPYADLRWVGNEKGSAGKTHYASIDACDLEAERPRVLNVGKQGGDRYIVSECDVSIRPGWFYHQEQDKDTKSVSRLNRLWFESVGRNSIMLLNFPPDRRGLVHEIDAKNAIGSHECISNMLSENLLMGASITADSTLGDLFAAENLLVDREEVFFAAKEKTVLIDIQTKTKKPFNVFAISEVLEAGERVSEWKLEAIQGEQATMLGSGTSIGHLRAIRFPEGVYPHLRLTVLNAAAPPVLRSIAAYHFEDVQDENSEAEKRNLMLSDLANVVYEDKGHTAILSFGGIYPFNFVSFKPCDPGKYAISVFNGSRYECLRDGTINKGIQSFRFDEPVEGCYQIKIFCESGFSCSNEFDVSLRKN